MCEICETLPSTKEFMGNWPLIKVKVHEQEIRE